MSFRLYLILMSVATTAAWVTWLVVLNAIDPAVAGTIGFILFFTTLSIAIFGTGSLLGVVYRLWQKTDEPKLRLTLHAFRQSILFTILLVSSLILFAQGWFRWWTMLLVVVIVSFIELIYISLKQSR